MLTCCMWAQQVREMTSDPVPLSLVVVDLGLMRGISGAG